MLVQDLVLVGVWTVWTFCIYIYINNVFCILQFYVDISSPNYMKLTVFQTGDGMSTLNKKQINIRDNCDTECRSDVASDTGGQSLERNAFLNSVCHNHPDFTINDFHLVSNTMLFIKTEH